MKEVSGQFNASGKKFAVICSRFNNFIAERLIEGAVDCLTRHGCSTDDLTLIRVPGCFEISAAARKAADSGKYDGIIGLGALIRGATPHFDYVAKSVTNGLSDIASEAKTAVSFGIITADSIEQAVERAGTKSGNKGFDAALAVIEMADLLSKI